MKQITIIPDKTLISEGRYKDELRITVKGNKIHFDCLVDGTGNGWIISKKELLEILK